MPTKSLTKEKIHSPMGIVTSMGWIGWPAMLAGVRIMKLLWKGPFYKPSDDTTSAPVPRGYICSMRKVRVAPKGMGLNDFVAERDGSFAAEGIEVEWDIKTFRGTQSSWKGSNYLQ